jgi:putative holliday junction resolvase
MPVVDLLDLPKALPPGQRLLGLDLGAKTLGLAISDSALRVATPLAALRRNKFSLDVAHLKALIDERDVGGLVLGLPVALDGREGRRCQSVRQFAANLLAEIDLPLAFWDERFSTLAVERSLREAKLSHRRRGRVVDKLAAAFILQGALDRLALASGRAPP